MRHVVSQSLLSLWIYCDSAYRGVFDIIARHSIIWTLDTAAISLTEIAASGRASPM